MAQGAVLAGGPANAPAPLAVSNYPVCGALFPLPPVHPAPLPPLHSTPGRFDLYKAVTAHGGPAAVAQALGWERWGGRRPNRKPRGYWDSLDNVRAEIDGVIAENGLPPGGW